MKNLRAILWCTVMFALVDTASALPRFSARTGWKCQACHVNPSGGGMRSAGGVTYGRDELPVPTWSEEFGLENFSTQITDFIGVGADARTLFFYQQDPTEDNNAFFQMQGDIYMNFRIAKKVNLYVDKGLYSGFEIFGQANVIPANGFVKAGKFVPNYGLKLDEHRAYVRQYTGLSQETGTPYYTGAEVAISPGVSTVTAGIFNSSDGRGASTGSEKAFLGRAEGLFSLSDDVNVGIGGNVLYKDVQGGKNMFVGGFGSFSYDTFTLIGEVDLLKNDVSGAKADTLVIYAEAGYMVVPGLDLKFMYDFYDKNREIKGGSLSRYSFGFEFFPIAGVEVRPLYRINKEDPTDSTNDEFHLLVHFYL